MGWTFQQSRGRSRLDIIRNELDHENDAYIQNVIDHAIVGTTVYLLVLRTPKGHWHPDHTYINDPDGSFRWIAVFLTRKDRDICDFGYKDMEESMGPAEHRCPKRLIARASTLRNPDPSVENNWAAQWRSKCLSRIAPRKRKLAHGTVIRLAHAIEFTNGYKGDLFTIHVTERRGRKRTLFKAPDGSLYRIMNLHSIGFAEEQPGILAVA